MKLCLVLTVAMPLIAQEPAKYTFTEGSTPVRAGVGTKTTRMEVIDRTEEGALVQTYSLKREYAPVYIGPENPGPVRRIIVEPTEPFRDVRVNGEILFVKGMVNGVGVAVEETTIYDLGKTISHKGTTYRGFSASMPDTPVTYVPTTTKSLNPAWIKWNEREQAKKRERETLRILSYQHQQASNGYASFQLELGRRYLRGDGVETNLTLARHWLQSACTNGEPQATNLLQQLSATR
jgi:hypothetical protein